LQVQPAFRNTAAPPSRPITQIVLAINEHDCTRDDGNTAKKFEAIAVTLLRAAEAVRNQEKCKLESLGHNGKALA
jgi:hypothetical protein